MRGRGAAHTSAAAPRSSATMVDLEASSRVASGAARVLASVGCILLALTVTACSVSLGTTDGGAEADAQRADTDAAAPADSGRDGDASEGRDAGDGTWLDVSGLPAGCVLRVALQPERVFPSFSSRACETPRTGCREWDVPRADPPDDTLFVMGAGRDDEGAHLVALWGRSSPRDERVRLMLSRDDGQTLGVLDADRLGPCSPLAGTYADGQVALALALPGGAGGTIVVGGSLDRLDELRVVTELSRAVLGTAAIQDIIPSRSGIAAGAAAGAIVLWIDWAGSVSTIAADPETSYWLDSVVGDAAYVSSIGVAPAVYVSIAGAAPTRLLELASGDAVTTRASVSRLFFQVGFARADITAYARMELHSTPAAPAPIAPSAVARVTDLAHPAISHAWASNDQVAALAADVDRVELVDATTGVVRDLRADPGDGWYRGPLAISGTEVMVEVARLDVRLPRSIQLHRLESIPAR